jgi:hypothetical protein
VVVYVEELPASFSFMILSLRMGYTKFLGLIAAIGLLDLHGSAIHRETE